MDYPIKCVHKEKYQVSLLHVPSVLKLLMYYYTRYILLIYCVNLYTSSCIERYYKYIRYKAHKISLKLYV